MPQSTTSPAHASVTPEVTQFLCLRHFAPSPTYHPTAHEEGAESVPFDVSQPPFYRPN